MTTPALKLPRGITYRLVARKFKVGYSIMGLAKIYNVEEFVIQHAIREVMRRQKRR